MDCPSAICGMASNERIKTDPILQTVLIKAKTQNQPGKAVLAPGLNCTACRSLPLSSSLREKR